MGLGYYVLHSMQMHDMEAGLQSERKLGELRDRAHEFEKRTGNAPLSWNDFSAANPPEEGHKARTVIFCAVAAAAVFTSIAMICMAAAPAVLFAAVGGALFGAIAGSYIDTENGRRSQQVDKYEHYLDQLEHANGRGLAKEQEVAGVKTTHAADLLASRAQQQVGRGA